MYLQNISRNSKKYPGVNFPGISFFKLMIASMGQHIGT
nr:MAG TPA: hypothetical protein [Caudoviricetes sp.]